MKYSKEEKKKKDSRKILIKWGKKKWKNSRNEILKGRWERKKKKKQKWNAKKKKEMVREQIEQLKYSRGDGKVKRTKRRKVLIRREKG